MNSNTEIFICRKFDFSASHTLKGCSEKCKKLHGHNYTLKVTLGGQLNSSGIIENLNYISNLINEKIIDTIDHTLLNDTLKINPSVENIALWIFNSINTIITDDKSIAKSTYLHMIDLEETDKNSARITNKIKH